MDTTKLYFDTEEEMEAYNAAEAESRGCDMITTIFWYNSGEDEDGYYIEIKDDE